MRYTLTWFNGESIQSITVRMQTIAEQLVIDNKLNEDGKALLYNDKGAVVKEWRQDVS